MRLPAVRQGGRQRPWRWALLAALALALAVPATADDPRVKVHIYKYGESLDPQRSQQFSEFKGGLTELAVSVLGPIGEEMQRLVSDTDYIDGILQQGGTKARAISGPIMREIQEIVGFVQP